MRQLSLPQFGHTAAQSMMAPRPAYSVHTTPIHERLGMAEGHRVLPLKTGTFGSSQAASAWTLNNGNPLGWSKATGSSTFNPWD